MTDAMMAAIHARTKRDRKKRILQKVKALHAFQNEGIRHLDTKGREARDAIERHQKAVYESKLVKLHHRGEFWYYEEDEEEEENRNEDEKGRMRSDTVSSDAAATAASLLRWDFLPMILPTHKQYQRIDR